RGEIALAIGEGFVELHREGMGEIIEYVFSWRDVDADVVPFLSRQYGEAALHQRLAGRDDLDDGGMPGLKSGIDGPDQCRGFHARQKVPEEALFRGFEGGSGGALGLAVQCAVAAGDVCRL